MKIHREGFLIIAIFLTILLGLESLIYFLYKTTGMLWLFILLTTMIAVVGYIVVQFFRVPKIKVNAGKLDIISPVDGKVVVIEETMENEYFKDKRIQVSIFMNLFNVHANFNPISGIIKYVKYHRGLFLVASLPKSSTENERTSIVVEHENGQQILHRQVAGLVARRICYYVNEGDSVEVGKEYGFIKFGSRIDLYLPLGTQIDVKIGDKVKGRITKIGSL